VNGYILKQLNPQKFNVTDGTHTATVMLAPTVAIASALSSNPTYCTIYAYPLNKVASGASFTVHYGVDSATLANSGGTNYVANNIITLASSGSATLTVLTVTGGAVTTFSISAIGSVTALLSNPVAQTGAVTGGTQQSGSGATFNLKYKVGTITGSSGTGYVGGAAPGGSAPYGDTLIFNGVVGTTQPAAHVATVSSGAVSTVTVDTAGSGITTAATSIGVNGPTEYISHIYSNRITTAEGNVYNWTKSVTSDGSAFVAVY
jgi:hypothetical protein